MAKKRAKKKTADPQPEQEAPDDELPEKEPANKNSADPQPKHVAPGHKGPDKTLRDRQATRIGRTIKILRLIQGRGRWNAQSLADELDCTVRTIYRDLDALGYAGVLWQYDKVYQCYRVRNEYCLPTPGLTEEEAIGQAVATVVTKASGLNAAGGAGPATRKLAAKSGEAIQQLMADAERLVTVLDLKLADHSKHYMAIKTIQMALIERKLLVGQYESPYESSPVHLRLHPYRLCLIKNAWYIIARPTDALEPRTYRVARFKSLRMLDTPARVPGKFDVREYFGNAWSVYRGSQTYDIEIWFVPEAARVVTETVWHHTQKSKSHPDGGVTLTFRVDGLEEIAGWLLSWAGRFRIVKPRELRDAVVKRIQRTLEMHQE